MNKSVITIAGKCGEHKGRLSGGLVHPPKDQVRPTWVMVSLCQPCDFVLVQATFNEEPILGVDYIIDYDKETARR